MVGGLVGAALGGTVGYGVGAPGMKVGGVVGAGVGGLDVGDGVGEPGKYVGTEEVGTNVG